MDMGRGGGNKTIDGPAVLELHQGGFQSWGSRTRRLLGLRSFQFFAEKYQIVLLV